MNGCKDNNSCTRTTNQPHITLGIAGDIMLGRLVNEVIDQKNYAYPWGNILTTLQNNDINLVNLETTLTHSANKVPKVFNFKATPDKVKTLQMGNISVVSLANNHIRDFGDEGLLETIAILNNAHIAHTGAGVNIIQARKPALVTKNGITIGVLGYTDNEPEWLATEHKPGINYIRIGDVETVLHDIVAIRDQVDVLIVSLHWGPNMRQKPSQTFIDFAHALIDNGVDIIHGHSAHIFQGIEVYKNKLILYDTGDFVDDYYVTPELRNDQSFLFNVTITKNGLEKLQLIPVLISAMQVNHTPADERQTIMQKMQKLSAEFNTHIPDSGILLLTS